MIIVIGILVGIAIPSYRSVLADGRDTERKTDISSIAIQVEQYYSRNGGYPSLSDLNDSSFRSVNRIASGDDVNWLADPKNNSEKTLTTSTTPTNTYSYIPLPVSCSSPTNSSGSPSGTSNPCQTYTLIARLESFDDSSKDSTLSTSTVAYYVKRNSTH